MNEREWVALVINMIRDPLQNRDPGLEISQGTRLPYAYEIRAYSAQGPQHKAVSYETDVLIREQQSNPNEWKPRVIIEAKLKTITTHGAIAYSEKASAHKQVHPYLRYGILLGGRSKYPLPGRLFRHGAYFDFMLSWKAYEPSIAELNGLVELIVDEVNASRDLEEIIYTSRRPQRKKYTCLHKPLRLKQFDQ